MPHSRKVREELIKSTREAAAAFVEDMDYIRLLVEGEKASRGDIRRLSAIVRRLLLDSDLMRIASPRIGRFWLTAPDNNLPYTLTKNEDVLFFASGRASVFGWTGSVCLFTEDKAEFSRNPARLADQMNNLDNIQLKTKDFLSQRVLYFSKKWASRRDVIKYVANTASGVHSDEPKDPVGRLLVNIRKSVSYSVDKKGGVNVQFFPDGFILDEIEFMYKPEVLDPVLIEILASARFLTLSPDVARLEAVIRRELAA